MSEPLAVLYEDAHVLAVDKPAGLLTQGRPGREPTLEELVRNSLTTAKTPDATSVYLGTVHRLDRPVSGVVVWARTTRAARRLAAQFAAREIVKEYWAVVEVADGRVAPAEGESGVWDDWLADSADASGRVCGVDAKTPSARRAVTRFEVARASSLPESMRWIKLRPETGRTHQLRAQAALRGLPILGDRTYGASRTLELKRGIALHARAITFRHPVTKREMTITAPLPAFWAREGLSLLEGTITG